MEEMLQKDGGHPPKKSRTGEKQAYYRMHKERLKEERKRHYRVNAESLKAAAKRRYYENKEVFKKKSRDYYDANKPVEVVRALMRRGTCSCHVTRKLLHVCQREVMPSSIIIPCFGFR